MPRKALNKSINYAPSARVWCIASLLLSRYAIDTH